MRALGPVSLEVHAGELVAIMGPSGSGKSTLLSLVGALDQPTEGRVLVGGEDLSRQTPVELAALRRRLIGFVFQDLNLLPGLTALENVALPLELDGRSLKEAREQAAEELRLVGLETLMDRFPENLSGGEQQRVAIAPRFRRATLPATGRRAHRRPRLSDRRGRHAAAEGAMRTRAHCRPGDPRRRPCRLGRPSLLPEGWTDRG